MRRGTTETDRQMPVAFVALARLIAIAMVAATRRRTRTLHHIRVRVGMGCNRGDGGSPVPPHSVTPTGAVVRFKVLAAWFGAMTNCWGSTSLAVWTCLYRMHGAGNAGAGHQTDGEMEWALSLSHPVQRMYKSGYLSYDKRWCDQVS